MAQYANALGKLISESLASTKTFSSTVAGSTLLGSQLNETFRGYTGTYAFAGGGGDDTYILGSAKDTVTEKGNAGVDTVRSYYKYILPENVENLVLLGPNAWFGGGNSLDNLLVGSDSAQQLDGGKGNDVLTGGGGKDVFIVRLGEGSDRVTDFALNADKVRLIDYGFTNFAQVKNITQQVGADTVLKFANGEKLVLSNVNASALTADNFELEHDRSDLKLTFGDEFNALSLYSAGGTWRTEYGYGGAGTLVSRSLNSENQIYMEAGYKGTSDHDLGVNPFSIDNGVLTITATPTAADVMPYVGDKTYTSGLLTSKFTFSQQYGYFEIRAKLPEGQGFWPAFWLLPTDNSWPPELDVFEQLGKDPSTLYMTTHFVDEKGKHDETQNKLHIDTTEFHTYGVDWGEEKITFYVDGVAVATQDTPESMKKEMFLLINLAVGGPWAGRPDETTGTGEFEIDYVRAYATDDTVSTTIDGVHTDYKRPPVAPDSEVPGHEQIFGTTAGETLTASRSYQELWGLSGNDTLRTNQGNTIMHGGTGNDLYFVSNSSQTVQENAGEGSDSVHSSISYTLPENVENLALTTTANINGIGNAMANRMTGNAGNNVIDGGAGNDSLDGGTAGNDTLIGGLGDDVFIIDHAGVTVVEDPGEGIDKVQAAVSYTLTAAVENLSLTGTASINGTGNALANVIVGNSGSNRINGLAGNDTLTGGSGADVFVVQAGTGSDVITDFARGTDRIDIESYGFTSFTQIQSALTQVGQNTVLNLGSGDKLTLNGVTASSLTAGDFMFVAPQAPKAPPAALLIQVKAALSATASSSGTDYELGSTLQNYGATDQVRNIAGNDLNNRIIGNARDNFIEGGKGDDQLQGGTAGNDWLAGGEGNDLYVVDRSNVSVVEQLGEGSDKVQAAITYTLTANVEKLSLSGTAAIDGTGNELANLIVGNGAANTLNGLQGNDTLTGGGGSDTFVFERGSGKDVITDFSVTDDTLQFHGFAQADLRMTQSGSNAIIDFGGTDTITLTNVNIYDPALISHFYFIG